METKHIRLRNLLDQAKSHKTAIDFCANIDMSPSYFTQIKTGRKAIGDGIARKVEAHLGLPRGWMDVPHDGDVAASDHDAMAAAYAIEAMPTPLKKAFKHLAFMVSAHCVSGHAIEDFSIELTDECTEVRKTS